MAFGPIRIKPNWHPCLLLILLLASSTCALGFKRPPRLGVLRRFNAGNPMRNLPASSLSRDYKTFYYDQTLDHFNFQPESYTTFKQRYVVNFKHWGGSQAAAPIFAYMGEEASLDDDGIDSIGLFNDNAAKFGALLLFIEHRFYGKSVPFGSIEKAMENGTIRGYFSSAQAIADYAEIILHLKQNLSAEASPVIVFGGSYGGMLAAWFRLKYPHIALGALASSAPILYFDDIIPSDGYYSVVSKDYREINESCYNTIKQSWSEIDKLAHQPNGLNILSQKFNTCTPLKDASELTDYLENEYTVAAQYDAPPDYPVSQICNGIEKASQGSADILAKIFSGLSNYLGKNHGCLNTTSDYFSSETLDGWYWQTCSEMVMPIGGGNTESMMMPLEPFDLNLYNKDCSDKYGVIPRTHWITTYYGGHDIKRVLKKFGSNIIFSNGLRDPYSSGGVLEDISDSIIALHTDKGSHCLDILPTRADDPEWLTSLRKREVEIISGWISEYYGRQSDLNKTSSSSSSGWSIRSHKLSLIKLIFPLLALSTLKI